MPRTFDQTGRDLGNVGESPRYSAPNSVGSSLWELLHAEQVQAEYRALGKEPPTVDEIRAGAAQAFFFDADPFESYAASLERFKQGAADVTAQVVKVATAAAAIYIGLEIMRHWPRKGRK